MWDGFKKLETHVHSAPVSCCSRLSPERLVARYTECGFDSIMLTNHYSRSYIEHNGVSEKEWLDLYIRGYHDVLEEGKRAGLEVFLGAEVTLFFPNSSYVRERYDEEFVANNYADYILVGVTEDFLRGTPMLCDLDAAGLHKICADNGILVIQAHPFRTEQHHSPKSPENLDGYEINGNIGFPTGPNVDGVLDLVRKNGLVATCGGDTHYEWNKLVSATFVPESVHDSVSLAEYLRRVRVPEFSVDEPDDKAAPIPEGDARWR